MSQRGSVCEKVCGCMSERECVRVSDGTRDSPAHYGTVMWVGECDCINVR